MFDGGVGLHKIFHVVLRYAVEIYGVPVTGHNPADVLCVPFEAASTEWDTR